MPLFLAVVFALLVAGACVGAEFSASMYQKCMNKTYNGKIYIKGSKLRQEITDGPMKQIALFRPDKSVVWLLQPTKKTYMRVSQRVIIGADDPVARARMKQMGVMKKLGTEKVSGYVCNKTQWATGGGAKYVLTEWKSDKLQIPVRTTFTGPNGNVLIEFRNIKEGGVPDSVFELPQGYKRVQTPSAPKEPNRR